MNATKLSEICAGRWPEIYLGFGFSKSMVSGKHVDCPDCLGKRKLRFSNYYGNGTVICNSCGTSGGLNFLLRYTELPFNKLRQEIIDMVGNTPDLLTEQPEDAVRLEREKQANNKIWMASKEVTRGDEVFKYLSNRGISGFVINSAQNIRFNESLSYWDFDEDSDSWKVLGKFPAMVSLVRDHTGKPATLHITYLQNGDKAPVDSPRKIRRSGGNNWDGGTVRLSQYHESQPIHVCEGIETALAVKTENPEFCIWSCLNAQNLKKFVPPPSVVSITIFGDNDASFTGHEAAYNLAKRLARGPNNNVEVVIPEQKETDFNDVLQAKNNRGAA